MQSLVFTSTNDTVTLRNGKVYSGKYTGDDPLVFKDHLGILYDFPRKDVETLVLSARKSRRHKRRRREPKSFPPGPRFTFAPTKRSILKILRPGSVSRRKWWTR